MAIFTMPMIPIRSLFNIEYNVVTRENSEGVRVVFGGLLREKEKERENERKGKMVYRENCEEEKKGKHSGNKCTANGFRPDRHPCMYGYTSFHPLNIGTWMKASEGRREEGI